MTHKTNNCPLTQPTDRQKKVSKHTELVLPGITQGTEPLISPIGDDQPMIGKADMASRMADALSCYD